MTEDRLLHLLGLGVLFFFSAFFSGSETALMAIDRLRVRYLVHKKFKGADRLEAILAHPDRLLGAILVGNNLVNIAASVFATTLFVSIYGERGEILTILILTPLLLIFSEVCPKTYAAKYPEKVSFLVLRPILGVIWLLFPVVWIVTGVSRLLTRTLKGEKEKPIISEDEIRTMITVGEEVGVVPHERQRMLQGVFNLSEIRVRDVMIPRTEVVGIEVGASLEEVLHLLIDSRHSRFPVYEENLDNVVGVIHSKDILKYVGRSESFALRKLARPPYFVPESKRIETLLQSFRRRRLHLAVVVDEYGGFEGIVTLEDIVEEIVGDIQDEHDVAEVLIRESAPGRFLVDGSTYLRTLNNRFKINLSEEHATTLAGFILRTLGTIPSEGDMCTANGISFTVRKVVDQRVEVIEMIFPEESSEQT